MSFFKKIESFFGKFFGGSAAVNEMHIAASDINLVTPALVLALQSAGQSEGSVEVTSVANETVTDLGTLSQLFAQAQTGSTTGDAQIVAILTSLKSNLGGLLATGHIKDAKTLATVTNVADAFITEAETVISMLPAATAPSA